MNQISILVNELRQADGDQTFDSIGLDGMYHYHRGDKII